MTGKIWLLVPCTDEGPWEPWYDRCFGFVIRAETEEQARHIASEDAGKEGEDAWLDAALSVCYELTGANGSNGVIMRDVWKA